MVENGRDIDAHCSAHFTLGLSTIVILTTSSTVASITSGAIALFLLRKEGQQHRLKGLSYIHSSMDEIKQGKLTVQDIALVTSALSISIQQSSLS